MLKSAAKRLLLRSLGVVTRISNTNGVLLTFDDGPDPEVTPAVLDILSYYETKAVFFIVGNRIQKAPELLIDVLKAGHAIGNHTNCHPLERAPPLRDYYRDVQACQSALH